VTAPLALAPDRGVPPGDEVAVLRAALRPDFLARAGWDPAAQVISPARTDPLLGLKECAVADCAASTVHTWADLCVTCRTRWKASDLGWEEFIGQPCGGRPGGDQPCRVSACPRPAKSAQGLCQTHTWQRQRHPGLLLEQWLARPEVQPLSSFGACIAGSCTAAAAHRNGLCHAHDAAWYRYRHDHPGAALAGWARHAVPARAAGHTVVLRGLAERAVAELLVGVQRRTDAGLRTRPTGIRYLVNLLHDQQAGSVQDLAQIPSTAIRRDAGALLRSLLAEVYCVLSDPGRERAKDVWQLPVFGLPGKLDFTGISQR
jgi:hypothetical protein